ncbi:transposase, partial [Sphingomonas sp.]
MMRDAFSRRLVQKTTVFGDRSHYLARYTHRVAISNARLVALLDG